jgi:hypothetical protein
MQTPMQKKFEPSNQLGRTLGPDIARPSAREIAALAHELWKARGCPEGSPETDCFALRSYSCTPARTNR